LHRYGAAQKVRAALIVVLTHGGSTARLVAKYRPAVPVLTVFVPTLTTDSLTWTCSGETPARQANLTRWGCTSRIQLTRSLKAAWFQPLKP
jgi:hypothetical protein